MNEYIFSQNYKIDTEIEHLATLPLGLWTVNHIFYKAIGTEV